MIRQYEVGFVANQLLKSAPFESEYRNTKESKTSAIVNRYSFIKSKAYEVHDISLTKTEAIAVSKILDTVWEIEPFGLLDEDLKVVDRVLKDVDVNYTRHVRGDVTTHAEPDPSRDYKSLNSGSPTRIYRRSMPFPDISVQNLQINESEIRQVLNDKDHIIESMIYGMGINETPVPNDLGTIKKQYEFLTQKGTIMNVNDKLNTVTYVGKEPASDMTDEQIFMLIKAKEDRSRDLSQIKNKPKKLLDQLNEIDREIAALVKYVDERGAK